VLAPGQRNSRTPWPNHLAPSRQASSAPPSAFKLFSIDSTAIRLSCAQGAVLRQPGPSSGKEPSALCAWETNRLNRTRRASTLADAGATIARCRKSSHRSRYRAPTPPTHLRTQARLTPWRRATSAKGTLAITSSSAPNTLPTLLTLPGSTSQGRIRSRLPQLPHTASRTGIKL
jgi:hypothetical protein